MNNTVRHINLHLPNSWADCTTDELEQIAAAVMYHQSRVSRFHPFEPISVKISVLFSINRLEIVSPPQEDKEKDPSYIVRFSNMDSEVAGDSSFELTVWQIHALCERLDWIFGKDSAPLVKFPYPTLELKRRLKKYEVSGPPALLDGYTWKEFRYLQDWMQIYILRQNQLHRISSSGKATTAQLRKSVYDADSARSHFLSVLFKTDMTDVFHDFDQVKWQVILFWWSSLMSILQKKFPRVFKEQPVKKGVKRDTPWDFYNHLMATLQKEYQLDEDAQNRETYSVTLQKLNNMATDAEQAKQLSRKYKSKR